MFPRGCCWVEMGLNSRFPPGPGEDQRTPFSLPGPWLSRPAPALPAKSEGGTFFSWCKTLPALGTEKNNRRQCSANICL